MLAPFFRDEKTAAPILRVDPYESENQWQSLYLACKLTSDPEAFELPSAFLYTAKSGEYNIRNGIQELFGYIFWMSNSDELS